MKISWFYGKSHTISCFNDINHDAYWHTDWYKKGDSPFWYSIEEFRYTVKVYVKDPKERKELLEIVKLVKNKLKSQSFIYKVNKKMNR